MSGFVSRVILLCAGTLFASCAPSIHALCYPQSSPYGAGLGTASSPYVICTAAHLQNVSQNLDADFIQTSNIDLTNNSTFAPIGSSTAPFTGGYNGNGFSISNWTYGNSSLSYVGLFGFVSGSASISNLNVVNFNLTGSTNVGLLVGDSASTSVQISNCSSSGAVLGSTTTGGSEGGLVGTFNGTLTHSQSSASVTGFAAVGGLIGSLVDGQVSTCSATGTVYGARAGPAYTGGFAGSVIPATFASISNSYSQAQVQSPGGSHVGSFVGQAWSANVVISDCYSSGHTSSTAASGGLIQNTSGCTVSGSYWDNVTTGQTSSGGGTGEPTSLMQTQSTYSGWDFVNTWYPPVPGQSYPTLR